MQAIQDVQDAIVDAESPQKKAVEWGKLGAQYGALGGRPTIDKDALLTSEEKVIRQQLDVEAERALQAAKVEERGEKFGFQAKANFCHLWRKAQKIVKDEDNLMSYFVKVTGRSKASLKAALEGEERWNKLCEAAGMSEKGQGLTKKEAQMPKYLRSRKVPAMQIPRLHCIGHFQPLIKTYQLPSIRRLVLDVRGS